MMMSFPWETIELISICFGIVLIILLTVAIADLLVGLVCMPFYS
jgi:hypothetical protein